MYFQQENSFRSETVWTVSELNDCVSQCLQVNFPPLRVSGEVRGFTRAASGHWYFTLKDETGELSCAMFAGNNRRMNFVPKTGDHLEVHGQVCVYRARGSYQMVVDSVRRAGLGQLYERFLRLKEKLQAEGLFDAARKKTLKRIYTKIGVVTSLQAAALRDVLTTLRRRAPYAKVTLFETAVQGEEAPGEIIRALKKAEASAEVEVILLVRGGGSLQDLWAFNDETLAHVLANLSKPVIVGVGHESDVTIADWVADLRAATPTAAAEHVTESAQVLLREIQEMQQALTFAFNRACNERAQLIDSLFREMPDPIKELSQAQALLSQNNHLLAALMQSQCQMRSEGVRSLRDSLLHPKSRLSAEKEKCLRLTEQLSPLMVQRVQLLEHNRVALTDLMTELSPQTILKKGYSYVTDHKGQFIKSSRNLPTGQALNVHWHDGEAKVHVID